MTDYLLLPPPYLRLCYQVTCFFSRIHASFFPFLTGAPKGACAEMAPKHGDHMPQTNSSPFTVTAEPDAGGSMVTVTISSPAADKFKGFLISARAPADVGANGGKNLGQFFAGDDGNSQTMTCNSTAVSSFPLSLSLSLKFSCLQGKDLMM